MDSITEIESGDAGSIIVSGSHGGKSSGRISQAISSKLVIFNDAGFGKDDAGIEALRMLEDSRIAAGTLSYNSARIGDGMDMWNNGIISSLNKPALSFGLKVEFLLQPQIIKIFNK